MRHIRLFGGFMLLIVSAVWLIFSGCENAAESSYTERNSPTTGRLNVYYDEGLDLHVKNQALTFESLYPNAHITLFGCAEDDAVKALYEDSCEAIVISRLLTENEKKVFKSRDFYPKFSAVARSGVAIITGVGTTIQKLSLNQIKTVLTTNYKIKDSTGEEEDLRVIFDKNNSSVIHYLKDSLLHGKVFSSSCSILNSTLESIRFVSTNKNTVAFIDYAWLSDTDDSLYKAYKGKIKFIAVGKEDSFVFPDQSSFKLGTYPLARTVYVYRKTGDFTLAKGFESFVASPKGQLIFLKQGLLPTKQSERKIEISTKPLGAE